MSELVDHAHRVRALTDFQRNLVVTAGAGTGKTSLLVGRLLAALLCQHIEPRRILALTFTDNAASEMRARIVRLLASVAAWVEHGAAAAIHPSDKVLLSALAIDAAHVRRAQELLETVDELPISTFHTFCRRLLQSHARELELAPVLRLVDEDAARATFDAQALAFYGSCTADQMREVLERFDTAELSELAWRLLELPEGTQLEPEPDRSHLASAREELARLIAEHAGARDDWHAAARVVLETYDRCIACDTVDPPPELILPGKRAPLGGKRELGEALSELLQELLEDHARALRPFVAQDDGSIGLALRFVAPLVRHCREQRRRSGELTFADLLLLAREALCANESLREAEGGSLLAILVDEFQDTDPLQYDVVFLLATERARGRVEAPLEARLRPGVLFIVGDAKQSIYRFRRADIAAFGKVVERIVAQGGDELHLDANFRSQPAVLELVNRVCEHTLAADEPFQWGYREVKPTRAPERGDRVTMLEIVTAEKPSAGDRREAEGHVVVATIRELLGEGIPHDGIGVLLRAATDLGWLLRPLRASGIPYVLQGSRRFWERHEIVVATALVSAIARPHDAVAVLAVLRSSFSEATDAQILAHCSAAKTLDYRAAPAGAGPVADGLARLAALRAEVVRLPLDAAMRRLVLAPELIIGAGSGFEGAQPIANLERLLLTVLADAPLDLEDAADRLARLARDQRDDEESPLFTEAQGAVHILTVHKSKGLEYDAVIIPDCARKPWSRDDELAAVERFAHGGRELVGIRIGKTRSSASWLAAWIGARHAKAEQRRLFYVAATRAKSRLVLLGASHPEDSALWQRDLEKGFPRGQPPWSVVHAIPHEPRAASEPFDAAETLAAARRFAELAAISHTRAPLRPSEREAVFSDPRARALGSAAHDYLARVELARDTADTELLHAVAAFHGAELADLEPIAHAFHAGELRRRLVRARRVLRECPIAYVDDERRAVHGVIDALVEEPDGWLVIDYKTDRRSDAEPHRAQLAAYAAGAQKALALAAPPRALVHFLRDDRSTML